MDPDSVIEEVEAIVEETRRSFRDAAQAAGITARTLRGYRSGDSTPSEAVLRCLTDWIEDVRGGDPYGGPADAEREPQAVAKEDITYGVGEHGANVNPPDPEVNGATSDTDFDPDQAIEEQHRRFRDKHRRAKKKKRQTIRFDTGPVCLIMVGDQHIGNAGTDVKRIFEEQDVIRQTPAAYVWQMGDVVDNFIVGRLKEQNMKPAAPIWEQWQLAQEYMDRWDERMVAFVGGNHGAWTMSETQIDYRRDICPDGVLYDGDDIRADVTVGSAKYEIWARHKWRGHSIYNPTHGQERAMRFADPDPDIYVGAHTHEGSMFREVIHEGRRKAAIQIGTYKVHDDHARKQGYPESDGSTACALILHDDGSYHGMADLQAAKRYMQAIYD